MQEKQRCYLLSYVTNANHWLDSFLPVIDKTFAWANQLAQSRLDLKKNVDVIVNDVIRENLMADSGLSGFLANSELIFITIASDMSKKQEIELEKNLKMLVALEAFRAGFRQRFPAQPANLLEDILDEGLGLQFELNLEKEFSLKLFAIDRKAQKLAESKSEIQKIYTMLRPRFFDTAYDEKLFSDCQNSYKLPNCAGLALGMNLAGKLLKKHQCDIYQLAKFDLTGLVHEISEI